MKRTYGSMFAGIGGIDLGFDRAGFECRWQVEKNEYCRKVLEKHWPDVPRFDDVRDFPTDDCAEQVDVICAGFPCQDISLAGKGAGLDGNRSGLFFEIIRVAGLLRPRAIFLENVSALLVRGLDRVLAELAAIGFDAEWHCLPAAAVGAPHRRDRIFIMAYAGSDGGTPQRSDGFQRPALDERGRAETSDRSGPGGDWPGDVPNSEGNGCRQGRAGRFARPDALLSDANGPGQSHGEGIATIAGVSGLRQSLQRYRQTRGFEQWSTEPRVGRMADGVPAWAHRNRALGNAVVPQVAEFFAVRMREVLDG